VTIGWDRLNAYVDKELDAAAAAGVAAAIARDPDLAARVATLSRLKANTRALPPSDLAAPALSLPSPWSVRRFAPLAASLVLLVAASVILWAWLPRAGEQGAWLAEAVAAHLAWLDAGSGAPEASNRIEIALEAREAAQIPVASEGGGDGIFLGYQGIHGCRVGLWIGEAVAGLQRRPAMVVSGGVAGYVWRTGNIGYALLARGMDPDRLRSLADAAARITGQHHRLDGDIRTALRHTAESGRPCLA
jgi:anti-sigma factor RsiW